MQIIKWVGHPLTLLIVYLLLIVEGDNFGGFYLLYLFLSVTHGVPFSIVALFGIIGLIVGLNIQSKKYNMVKRLVYFVSFVLMIVSLVLFFATGYNWKTFDETIPKSTFVLFGICSICFLTRTIWLSAVTSRSFTV